MVIGCPGHDKFWLCQGRHGFHEHYHRWVSNPLAGIHPSVGFRTMMWRAPQKEPQAQAKCGRHLVEKLAPSSPGQNLTRAGGPLRHWVDRRLCCDGPPYVASRRIFVTISQPWKITVSVYVFHFSIFLGYKIWLITYNNL